MDGSPPVYFFDKGSDSGIDNWLIHVEGGAWCENATVCLEKRDTRLGSSTKMDTNYTFSGILSNRQKYNPDFYNWNRVKIKYCDGSSFTGDVEAVDPKTKLYYRGARVWKALMDELMEKGMKNAKSALLAGCSAGGLTIILHCDSFRDMLSSMARMYKGDHAFQKCSPELLLPINQQRICQHLAPPSSAPASASSRNMQLKGSRLLCSC